MAFGSLTIFDASGSQRVVVLEKPIVRIGSALDNDIIIQDNGIEAHHAQILCDPGRVQLFDTSNSGIVINDAPLLQNPQPLQQGNVITIGRTRLMLDQLGPTTEPNKPLGSTTDRLKDPDSDLLEALIEQQGSIHRPSAKITQPLHIRPGQSIPITQPLNVIEPGATAPPKIEIRIDPKYKDLIVAPGNPVSFNVRVDNESEYVDKIDLSVESELQQWIAITPSSHSLLTKRESRSDSKATYRGESVVTVLPPRNPTCQAGTYTVKILAHSRDRPTRPVEETVSITVQPYVEFDIDLDPKKRTRWNNGPYKLKIANTGNETRSFKLEARDEEEQMAFQFKPSSPVKIKPGETQIVRANARVEAARLIGKPQEHPFTVSVTPDSSLAGPKGEEALFIQRPPLGFWVIPAMIGLSLVLCILLALARFVPQIGIAVKPLNDTLKTAVARIFPNPSTVVAASSPTNQPTNTPQPTYTPLATFTPQATYPPLATLVPLPTHTPLPTYTPQPTSIQQTPVPSATPNPSVIATYLAQTRTSEAFGTAQVNLAQTQTVLARTATPTLTPTPTSTPTPTPVTTQLISFASVNGTPVTTRTPLNGKEYQQQNVNLCFFLMRRAPTPTPTDTPSPTPTDTSSPTPTDTPSPTLTDTPSPTPTDTSGPISSTISIGSLQQTGDSVLLTRGTFSLSRSILLQQSSPCLPQFVSLTEQQGAADAEDTVSTSFAPVIYPPNSGVPDANVYVVTADNGPNEFVNGATSVIIFPIGISDVKVTLWHPGDHTATYRMYVLDEAGDVITTSPTRQQTTSGEVELLPIGPTNRPIRSVAIVSLANSGSGTLKTDILDAQWPVFIKQIQIPVIQ